MRGVVMGHDHDRPLGVGGPDLRQDVMGAPLREQLPEGARSGGISSAISADAAVPVSSGERAPQPPATTGGQARQRADACQQADRPPEGPVGHRLLLDAHLLGAGVAQRARQPLRRAPLPFGEAEPRSYAQSSSRRSRIQAASGGAEIPWAASVAMPEN